MPNATDSQPPQRAQQPPDGPAPPARPRFRISPPWVILALVLLAFNFWAGSNAMQGPQLVRVPYSPFFLAQVRSGNVEEITSVGTAIQGTFEKPTTYGGEKPTTGFETEVPAFADTVSLSQLLETNGVVVNAKPLSTGAPWWQTVLVGFGPTLLFLGLLFLLLRRAGGMQNALSSFGRSRARRYAPSGDRVTFADVAGIEEAKSELSEVVDFLRHPEKYGRLGGRIPHGVLLAGPPGTGKTLLARAVAGEADVPFFSMAASEFVEAIVGVGAARVRDLFVQAKQSSPSIVFIDELDAIGRSRTAGIAGYSGGNDEREQTLNQILTEMDGFDSSTGVIVIAATNRPEVLDRRCCGRAGSTAGWRCSHPTETGVARSSRCTRAGYRLPRASIWAGSRRRRPGWSAPTSPTWSTRPHCWPLAESTSRSRRRTSPMRSSGSCSAPSGRS